MLHKQPPERPLLHLHLVSEIVHLASHKYQQFMDMTKVRILLFVFFHTFSEQDEEKFLNSRSDKHSYYHIIHIFPGGQDEEELLARSFQHNRLSFPLLSH